MAQQFSYHRVIRIAFSCIRTSIMFGQGGVCRCFLDRLNYPLHDWTRSCTQAQLRLMCCDCPQLNAPVRSPWQGESSECQDRRLIGQPAFTVRGWAEAPSLGSQAADLKTTAHIFNVGCKMHHTVECMQSYIIVIGTTHTNRMCVWCNAIPGLHVATMLRPSLPNNRPMQKWLRHSLGTTDQRLSYSDLP